jgi:hypothetical protein
MTSAARTPMDLLALWHPCGYCGAKPGHWCRVARGRTVGRLAPWLHGDREYPTSRARHIGYTDGQVDAYAEIAHAIQTAGERWSQLPADPTLDDVLAYVRTRQQQRSGWLETALDQVRSDLRDWRREPAA